MSQGDTVARKSMNYRRGRVANWEVVVGYEFCVMEIDVYYIISIGCMNLKKHELNEKLEKSQAFYKQMLKAEQNYKSLKAHATYSSLSTVNEILISKFECDKTMAIDIYFVYGIYINEVKISMDAITQYFVSAFPKPKKPYFFVYFNDYDSPNNFSNFKDMLGIMPLEYFLNLEAIFLVRPSLRMKASRYFTFGTISKYINSKTINIDNIEELSDRIGIKKQEIMKFLPHEVRNYFCQEEQEKSPIELKVPTSLGMVNSSGPSYNRQASKYSPTNSASNSPKSQMVKSQKPSSLIVGSKIQSPPPLPKLEIDQYDKSQRGIPEVFEIMIHYFRQHTHELEEEGIFRKSVSIDDENLALEKIHNKEYDYLEKVKDPHLIANLMKRFLSKLKTPIIPYPIFDQLMNREPLNSELVSEQMRDLSNSHFTKYLTLAILLDFLIRKVIPRSHKNKMPAQNVAICFAPCLMWAEQRSIKDLAYINKSVAVVLIMINNFEEIFGTKKELHKVIRTSFYEQQKKNIVETYNIEMPHEVQSLQEQRKTPNFGLLVYQRTQNEHKAQESDDSPLEEEKDAKKPIQINVISPNKSTTKSQVEKSELIQLQNELEEEERKSERAKKDKPLISDVYSPTIQVTSKIPTNRKKIMFQPEVESPKSQNCVNIQAKGRVSQNKSDNQIKSIHSGRSDKGNPKI